MSEEVAAAPGAAASRTSWVRTLGVGAAIVLIVGVGLLPRVIPLRSFADKLERGLGGWLHTRRCRSRA